MQLFGRINRLLLVPMVFLLPAWLTFGRALLGSSGWGALFYFFMIAPALLVTLGIFALLIKPVPGTDGKKILNPQDSLLMTSVYISVFLHGFFLLDGDDNADHIASVATNLFGTGFRAASQGLSEVFLWLSFGLLIVTFVFLVRERLRKR